MNQVLEFQRKYPTKAEKEEALSNMSNEQIDELINDTVNVQAKIFYSRFKKKKPDDQNK